MLGRILTAPGVGAQREPMSLKLLRDVPFGAVLCLVGTNCINSANKTPMTAEAMGQLNVIPPYTALNRYRILSFKRPEAKSPLRY